MTTVDIHGEQRERHHEPFVFKYILCKLASRCNIACSYCYWFRDDTVYKKPATLTPEAERAFLARLEAHIRRYKVDDFFILFHGGEPLLFGKARFAGLCEALRRMEAELGFKLKLAITTNGLLIDREWIDLLMRYRVLATLSIDGPALVNDQHRVDFKGLGTFRPTVAAFHLMRSEGWEPGLLAVCNPEHDPEVIGRFFIEELAAPGFDILVPDATHEDNPPSIAAYYRKLFDLWYDEYAAKGVKIRFLESVTKGLLGLESHSESIGYGPTTTFTLLTDGSLEPLDVLRIAGNGSTRTHYNVFEHELMDIQADPLWREARDASVRLAPVCEACPYREACGGGHLASRWSKANRYDNPSVYCEDIKQIMRHAWSRISKDLYIETPDGEIPLLQAL